jgi:parvulin-like peptidyl-prolyl isomerase
MLIPRTSRAGCFLLLAVVAFSAAAQDSRRPSAMPVDGIVAIVNDEPVTLRDVAIEMRKIVQSDPEARKMSRSDLQFEALRNLVTDRMLSRVASRSAIEIDATKVDERIGDMRRSIGSEREFSTLLSAEGMTLRDLRRFFEDDLRSREYVNAYFGLARPEGPEAPRPRADVDPSPREMRRYYRLHPETFTLLPTVRVRRVYLSNSRHSGPEETRRAAEALRARAAAGEDFEALAREHSDLGGDAGGDLGRIVLDGKSGHPEEMLDFARSAPIGAVSPLLGGDPGFYFVQVVERTEGRVIPFSEAQESIRGYLRTERHQQVLNRMFEEMMQEAVIWPDDLERALRRIP